MTRVEVSYAIASFILEKQAEGCGRDLSVFPIEVECGVDREVHAAAGQEAGATSSCSDR
jgi:hypothetical protein